MSLVHQFSTLAWTEYLAKMQIKVAKVRILEVLHEGKANSIQDLI